MKYSSIIGGMIAVASCAAYAQPSVRVEVPTFEGSQHLASQTAETAVRNYLQAWNSLEVALEQNRAELLDSDFIGTAKQQLEGTIQQQVSLGLSTRYRDLSHDLQIVFYSADGLSVELIDKVTCEVQLLDHGKLVTTQRTDTRYVVQLTPAEVRWRVRVFQAGT